MFQAQQNYMIYPQFGTVNFLSNFNHNTWHSGNIAIEKRYGNGLIFNTSYNLSKSLSNDDSLTYYNRQGKARTAYDSRHQFGAFLVYELPVGKGKKWVNQGGLHEQRVWRVEGGHYREHQLWCAHLRNALRQPEPLSDGSRASIRRQRSKMPEVPDWDMGQRFPTAAQTPYFNMSSFAYPDAYTIGSLGSRVLQAPALLWMQCFATKSWRPVGERFMLSFRVDGHNLPHKRPNLAAPNTHVQPEQYERLGSFHGRGWRFF